MTKRKNKRKKTIKKTKKGKITQNGKKNREI